MKLTIYLNDYAIDELDFLVDRRERYLKELPFESKKVTRSEIIKDAIHYYFEEKPY